jgi:hypothetical protein
MVPFFILMFELFPVALFQKKKKTWVVGNGKLWFVWVSSYVNLYLLELTLWNPFLLNLYLRVLKLTHSLTIL